MKKLLLALTLLLPVSAYAQTQVEVFPPGFISPDGTKMNKNGSLLQNLTNYSYQLLTAGSAFYTYTVPNTVGIVMFDIASGPISDERVTAPANPYDGQQVAIASSVTITAFQFIANTGQTLAVTTPTVLTASTTVPQGYKWIYRQANKKWYRLQ